MNERSEGMRRVLAQFTEEDFAAMDAEIADPNYQLPTDVLRDDPDPFGMDWKWLSPLQEGRPTSGAPQAGGVAPGTPAILGFPVSVERRSRWTNYGIGAAAAVLVIGTLAGLWAVWPHARPGETLLASLTPQPPKERAGFPHRAVRLIEPGKYQVQTDGAFHLVLTSPRHGYASLILMTARETVVYPNPGASAIILEPLAEQVSPPLPLHEKTIVVLVITERPATDSLRTFFGPAVVPAGDLPTRLEALKQALWKNGYTWTALGHLMVEPDDKQ